MVDPYDGTSEEGLESRPPTLEDLLALCQALNEAGARYILVGGMAVIQHGFVRATEDIDLLVDSSPENFERIRQAMRTLPDRAIDQVKATDLDEFLVVRVADEIVVDLMKSACGVEYDEGASEIEEVTIDGVVLPVASATLLLKLKQTVRAKDELDRLFLEQVLAARQSDGSV